MNTCVNLLTFAEFLSEWEMFEKKICGENQNTHLTFNNFFFRKSCRLWDNVEKYGRARQARDDDIIWRMRET
jgi:hypothetical protein